MKKFIASLFVFALAVSMLTACSNKDEGKSENKSDTTASTKATTTAATTTVPVVEGESTAETTTISADTDGTDTTVTTAIDNGETGTTVNQTNTVKKTTTKNSDITTSKVTTPKKTTTTKATTPKKTTTTKVTTKEPNKGKEVKLNVIGINGYRELESGSGITAAATVLGYYKINIKPLDLREYADIHGTSIIEDGVTPSPWDVIVNEPIGPISFYYAKPIINMTNKYLDEKGISNIKAYDISGATLDDLCDYIDIGKPVIVWGTSTGNPAEESDVSWILPNGETFVAREPLCVYTLIGYTNTDVIILDDVGEELIVSKEIFTTMYESMYSQAILIE